jgi:hypothetical protein
MCSAGSGGLMLREQCMSTWVTKSKKFARKFRFREFE